MQTTVLLNHILNNTIALREEIMNNKSTGWFKKCEQYLKEAGIKFEELEEMTRTEIRKRCRRANDSEWRSGMEDKSSLKHYRKWKKVMGRGRMWMSCRQHRSIKAMQGNTLLTKGRIGATEEDKKCDVCNVKEDLEHIVKDCIKFEDIRKKYKIEERMRIENILFEGDESFLIEIHNRWNTE